MNESSGRILTIKAETPAYGGITIGRHDGKVVMIKGAIPGETVEARVDEEKKDYSTATVVRVVEPSPDRVEPPCGHFGLCGGCQLQYIAYGRQVTIKEEVLRNTILRIAKLDVALSDPLTGEPWNYRHRGQFKVAGDAAGFFGEKSRDIVDIDSSPLMTKEVNEFYGRAKTLIKDTGTSELHVSCGDGAAALVKLPGVNGTSADKLGKSLMDAGFTAVFIERDKRNVYKYGRGYIELELDGLKYTVSPASFFQSNWRLNQALVGLVREHLSPLDGKHVLDLYSGAGNFSLPLARYARKVTAVEENPPAVEDGKRNARLNGIRNCSFIRTPVDRLRVAEPVDVLITDPPRTGLTDSAVELILAKRPGQVVYVSCNPATFARDLKKLSAKYYVESIRLVDFFPQTYHIESAAFLRLTPP